MNCASVIKSSLGKKTAFGIDCCMSVAKPLRSETHVGEGLIFVQPLQNAGGGLHPGLDTISMGFLRCCNTDSIRLQSLDVSGMKVRSQEYASNHALESCFDISNTCV